MTRSTPIAKAPSNPGQGVWHIRCIEEDVTFLSPILGETSAKRGLVSRLGDDLSGITCQKRSNFETRSLATSPCGAHITSAYVIHAC